MNLKDKLRKYDYESLEESPIVEVTKEEVVEAINTLAEAKDISRELSELNDTVSKLLETKDELNSKIEETVAGMDDMTPVEVVKAVTTIENAMNEVIDVKPIEMDMESLHTTKAAISNYIDLENKAFDMVKGLFKKSEPTFKTMLVKARNEWYNANKVLIADAKASLAKRSDKVSIETVPNRGSRLAGVYAAKCKPEDLVQHYSMLKVVDGGQSKISKGLAKYVTGLKNNESVIVSDMNGIDMKYMVLMSKDGVYGVTKYSTGKITDSSFIVNIDDETINKSRVAKLLDTATKLNDMIKSMADVLEVEVDSIQAQLSGDIERAEYESGPMLKFGVWNWIFFVSGFLGFPLVSLVSVLESTRDSKRTYEELSAAEKKRVLENRIRFTSKYANDVMSSINNSISELIKEANALTNCLDAK